MLPPHWSTANCQLALLHHSKDSRWSSLGISVTFLVRFTHSEPCCPFSRMHEWVPHGVGCETLFSTEAPSCATAPAPDPQPEVKLATKGNTAVGPEVELRWQPLSITSGRTSNSLRDTCGPKVNDVRHIFLPRLSQRDPGGRSAQNFVRNCAHSSPAFPQSCKGLAMPVSGALGLEVGQKAATMVFGSEVRSLVASLRVSFVTFAIILD